MFGRSRTAEAKERASAASELAAALAKDKKFRRQMIAAAKHGSRAKQRAAERIGALGVVGRLAADAEVRTETARMVRDLQAAWRRLDSKRQHRHRLRNTLVLLAGAGGAAAAFRQRSRGSSLPASGVSPGQTT